MKKLMKIALAVTLVLISVTACKPQYAFYPGVLPGGGDDNSSPSISYTEAKTPEEFKTLIESGTPVSVPATNDPDEQYILPSNLTKPVIIKGAEEGAKVYIPVTGDLGNNGYNLPAGSKLEDIEVEFSKDVSTYAVNDTEPQFAMVIPEGNGTTTISNVDFTFPADKSLSGICIWNASDVSISDVTFTGIPARAPFNISGSTVKFSGEIDATEGSGWYAGITVIQINGLGSDHKPSTVTFNNVTGIDAVWQEVVEGTYGSDTSVNYGTPSGSTVSGLNGFVPFYMERPDKNQTRGWFWANSEAAKQVGVLYLVPAAHERLLNRLAGYEDETLEVVPSIFTEKAEYKLTLDGYNYTALNSYIKDPSNEDIYATVKGVGEVTLEFKDLIEGEGNLTSSAWELDGKIKSTIDIPTISISMGDQSTDIPHMILKADVDMENLSGGFTDGPATFTADDNGQYKITGTDSLKFDYSNVSGKVTVNGVSYTGTEIADALAEIQENMSLGF